MPDIQSDQLEDLCVAVLQAAGASAADARLVARHLVDNDTIGHSSHGVLRLPDYVGAIDRGELIPSAGPVIESESASTARVDGAWAFGQVVAEFATDLAIRKARDSGIAAVTMRRTKHIGRVGRYAEKAASSSMASLIFTCAGGHGINQAPFRGAERRLSSNPIAMSFPSSLDGPYLLDMATSVVAEGKVRTYRYRGEETPPGWIIDSDGNPTTDPADYYAGGAILPLGRREGHKGYALAFMVELFGGILSGGGIPGDPADSFSNDSTIIVLDPQRFTPIDRAKSRASTLTDHFKATRLLDDSEPIMYPGEIEATARVANRDQPIDLLEVTWEGILSVLRKYSLPEPRLGLPDQPMTRTG